MSKHVVSDRMLAANRANALRSTGPRTDKGKARSRLNGLLASPLTRATIISVGDCPDDTSQFLAFLADVRATHAPAGNIEKTLVDRLAQILWRLSRVHRFETGAILTRQIRYEDMLNRELHRTLGDLDALKHRSQPGAQPTRPGAPGQGSGPRETREPLIAPAY